MGPLYSPSAPGRPTRKRASNPKVRTGCINCKQRHLKCDEKKPHCLRCKDFGVLCRGYAAVKSGTPGERRQRRVEKALLPAVRITTAVDHLPTPIPRLKPSDVQYLAFFSQGAAMSPYYPTRFWSHICLRETSTNDCILHAVLGIGACGLAVEEARNAQRGNSSTPTPAIAVRRSLWDRAQGTRHHYAAVAHYAKAVQLLRATLKIRADGRASMIATLLFIAFENMQGNYHVSGRLIRSGLKICRSLAEPVSMGDRLSSRSVRNYFPRGDYGDITEMAQMYARHSITSLFMPFPHCRSAYHMLVDARMAPSSVKEFATVQEARVTWDFYLPSLASFIQKCTWRNVNVAYDFDLPAARREQGVHQVWMSSFDGALERLYATTCRINPISRISEALENPMLLLLSLHHKVAAIFLRCCLDTSERIYDAHVHQFRDAIYKCSDLAPGSSAFVNDASILPIISFVACKCRDWKVRQQALSLLDRYEWREGGWDSLSLGKGIRALINLERRGRRLAWTAASDSRLEFTWLVPVADGYEKIEVDL